MEEKYIAFKVGEDTYSIKLKENVLIEPTQINKVSKDKVSKKHYLEFKSNIFEVIDLSMINRKKSLKKFDGLILVTKKDGRRYAFKFEGFFSYCNKLDKEYKLVDFASIDSLVVV